MNYYVRRTGARIGQDRPDDLGRIEDLYVHQAIAYENWQSAFRAARGSVADPTTAARLAGAAGSAKASYDGARAVYLAAVTAATAAGTFSPTQSMVDDARRAADASYVAWQAAENEWRNAQVVDPGSAPAKRAIADAAMAHHQDAVADANAISAAFAAAPNAPTPNVPTGTGTTPNVPTGTEPPRTNVREGLVALLLLSPAILVLGMLALPRKRRRSV